MNAIETLILTAIISFLIWDRFFKPVKEIVDQEPEIKHLAPETEFIKEGYCLGTPARYLLFLDFDGVLHEGENDTLKYITNFENILLNFPQVDIVLSTNWRLNNSFSLLRSKFSSQFQRRIIGYIGQLEDCLKYDRYFEISQWVKDYSANPKWIALDDDSKLFPDDFDQLFLLQRNTALNEYEASRLNVELEKLTSF